MKIIAVLIAVMSALLGIGAQRVTAQSYHDDGGLIVTENSLLPPNKQQMVFVLAKDIPRPARVELQTYSLEGIVNRFTPMQFPQGLKRGQIIPVWNAEFNAFHITPWLYLAVTIFDGNDIYHTVTMFPVQYGEQYKEPMVTSIVETGGYAVPYQITLRGIFDTTIPSLILVNTDVFVSPKTITQTAPGKIEFTMESNTITQFPPGKYLLTLCQEGRCDTLEGRHR